MRRGLPLLTLLAALPAASGCAGKRGAEPPAQKALGPGAAAVTSLPEHELRRLDGTSTTIARELAGHPALVSLWATWCESCTAELEALGRLSERGAKAGSRVVAIAVGEPVEAVRRYVEEHGLSYLQLVDPEFVFTDAIGQRRVPATLVVDAGGRVIFVGGALDDRAIAALGEASREAASVTVENR